MQSQTAISNRTEVQIQVCFEVCILDSSSESGGKLTFGRTKLKVALPHHPRGWIHGSVHTSQVYFTGLGGLRSEFI